MDRQLLGKRKEKKKFCLIDSHCLKVKERQRSVCKRERETDKKNRTPLNLAHSSLCKLQLVSSVAEYEEEEEEVRGQKFEIYLAVALASHVHLIGVPGWP